MGLRKTLIIGLLLSGGFLWISCRTAMGQGSQFNTTTAVPVTLTAGNIMNAGTSIKESFLPNPFPLSNLSIAPLVLNSGGTIGGSGSVSVQPPVNISTPVPVNIPAPTTTYQVPAQVPVFQSPTTIQTFSQPLPTDISRMQMPVLPTDLAPMCVDVHPGSFQFAMSSYQVTGGAAVSFCMIPTRGALYSVEQADRVRLARGRMFVAGGRSLVTVEAGSLTIFIEKGGAAIVESDGKGFSRIYSLTGTEGGKSHVRVAAGPNRDQSVILRAGIDVLVAKNSESSGKALHGDHLSRKPAASLDLLPDATVSEFSLSELAIKNFFLPFKIMEDQALSSSSKPCMATQSTNNTVALLRDVYKQVKREGAAQAAFKTGNSLASGAPSIVPPRGLSDTSNRQGYHHARHEKDSFIIAADGSTYKLEGDLLNLERGTIALWSKDAQQIVCGNHSVNVKSGTCCIVQFNGVALKLINLCDNHSNAMNVVSNRHSYTVPTSSEVIVSEQPPSFKDVYEVHKIGHRRLETKEIIGLGWVTRSEISPLDTLKHHPLLSSIRFDKGSQSKQKAVDRITRMAAIVAVLGGRRGSYMRGEATDVADADGVPNVIGDNHVQKQSPIMATTAYEVGSR